MTDDPEQGSPMRGSQDNPASEAPSSARFDPDAFRGFIDLLGRKQALFWLNDFRAGLCSTFLAPAAQTTLPSRAVIHHLCGRAGIMGFTGLHNACHRVLETDAGRDDAASARLRAEVQFALQEIARQDAKLA